VADLTGPSSSLFPMAALLSVRGSESALAGRWYAMMLA
jgi:hypothetical protein